MEPTDFANALGSIGEFIYNFMTTIESMYLAAFLFFTFMMFAIFLAIIGKVPGMGDGSKANKYGKTAAFALAFISGLSIFAIVKDKDPASVLKNMLPMYAIFAGAILACFFFAVIYFGFGKKEEGRWHLLITGTGFLVAIAGHIISRPELIAWGYVQGAIAIVLYLFSTGAVKEVLSAAKEDGGSGKAAAAPSPKHSSKPEKK